jgi:hypothetical protein
MQRLQEKTAVEIERKLTKPTAKRPNDDFYQTREKQTENPDL